MTNDDKLEIADNNKFICATCKNYCIGESIFHCGFCGSSMMITKPVTPSSIKGERQKKHE